MQTLPEFAVEAVLAWHQSIPLLIANLTGALRLLTGIGWPAIYLTAAVFYRKRTGSPLREVEIHRHHSVEVLGLTLPLLYAFVIWSTGSLHLFDAAVLIALYLGYLALLTRLPPQQREKVDNLEAIPHRIVVAPRGRRILAIAGCFLAGGVLIYFTAEPFLGSLIALSIAIGIPSFAVIQWLAPVISEFPELASTFYFARQKENASIALMNIASSNINQWTLLMAMLPIVFSLSRGDASAIPLDAQQRSELLLTVAQSLAGLVFLLNMKFGWWEALTMFVLFAAQFILPAFLGNRVRLWITGTFFVWAGAGFLEMIFRRRAPQALVAFREIWREHVGHRH